jgi:hypothetical protein
MKNLLLVTSLVLLGCTISPVVSDPRPHGTDRYAECRRAAKDYCREVVNSPSAEMDRCVADHAFRCTSGGD